MPRTGHRQHEFSDPAAVWRNKGTAFLYFATMAATRTIKGTAFLYFAKTAATRTIKGTAFLYFAKTAATRTIKGTAFLYFTKMFARRLVNETRRGRAAAGSNELRRRPALRTYPKTSARRKQIQAQAKWSIAS
jgi:hypothetical protein